MEEVIGYLLKIILRILFEIIAFLFQVIIQIILEIIFRILIPIFFCIASIVFPIISFGKVWVESWNSDMIIEYTRWGFFRTENNKILVSVDQAPWYGMLFSFIGLFIAVFSYVYQ